MRRPLVFMILGVLALATGAIAQDAQKHVFVTVLDKDGVPISGLPPDFFAVRESGKDRPVIRVEPLRALMHIAVLLDMTAIGAPDESMRNAVIDFVERLASLNKVAVYGCWNGGVRAIAYDSLPMQRREALSALLAFPSTQSQLIDAMDKASREFELVETARPVMIAITSEMPESSRTSAGSVIKRLIAQSIAFHAVTLTARTAGNASTVSTSIPESSRRMQAMISAGEGDRERMQIVKQGTAATGGGEQRLTTTMALAGALSRLANELSNGYRVTFTREGSDKIKDLQVGIMLDGVTLRATAAPFGTR
jgi:hypothetical protein